jgi:isopentenyl diphosphate isomerase/L-lactate dehydrogenase-like FMN-dependent dehydrogenase
MTRAVAQAARATGAARLVPLGDLVNVLEFEAQAKAALPAGAFASVAGGDRAPFDRITLRPRMCVSTVDLDLSVTLFGDRHFAPIIVGPVANQEQFHPEAEAATLAGATAAQAAVVLGPMSRQPAETLIAAAKVPVWFQIYASDMKASSRPGADDPVSRSRRAVDAGCKVVCVTVGAPQRREPPSREDWRAVSSMKRAIRVPVIAKGIATADDARRALEAGVDGVVVSTSGAASPILTLASIVDVAAGRVPVLVDGGFVRGSDIIKALAFGAAAVLVARPVTWGLAAYGKDGVQSVLEMLQTELARFMAMSGKPNVNALDRSVLKVHGLGVSRAVAP